MSAPQPNLAARSASDLPAVRGRLITNAPIGRQSWFRRRRTGGGAVLARRSEGPRRLAPDLPVDVPVTVIGGASNLLIRDGGVPGVSIRLGRGFAGIAIGKQEIVAGAGALDLNIALCAAKAGIAGLEFLSGIPGTLGGGLRMNAGAYGVRNQGYSGLGDSARPQRRPP